jgi:BirA family biotin operon repressor/biotin-[acetyl-CoA-carboxylase] ligase
LKSEEILKKLKTQGVDIICLECVDSTNEYLKTLAKSGAEAKTVVISDMQTHGKGTKNRSFVSRKGGVYLSILLKPEFSGFDATLITPLTAVAVSDAVYNISGKSTQIKWVNDLYLGGKKVCGILCEAGFERDSNTPFIVVGIGVNLFKPKGDFDAEIKEIATAVFEDENLKIKEDFIANLIDVFFNYYAEIEQKTFLQKYKNANLVLGKEIEFLENSVFKTAKAIEIDDDCRLVVELPDKTLKTLSSGDVKIKV